MEKNVKIKQTQSNHSKIIIPFLIIVILVFILLALLNFHNKFNIDYNKKTKSIVTQKSFIITNESGSIKKEIPIEPPSVGDIKFENPVNLPKPTPTNTVIMQIKPQNSGNYNYLFNQIDSKDKIYRLDIASAKFLYDSGNAIFIDARNPKEYRESHIKSAISIPTDATPDEINDLKNVLKGKILVTYCHGIGCHLSDKVAYKLYDMGYRNIAIFFGGWNQWVENNYPVEK